MACIAHVLGNQNGFHAFVQAEHFQNVFGGAMDIHHRNFVHEILQFAPGGLVLYCSQSRLRIVAETGGVAGNFLEKDSAENPAFCGVSPLTGHVAWSRTKDRLQPGIERATTDETLLTPLKFADTTPPQADWDRLRRIGDRAAKEGRLPLAGSAVLVEAPAPAAAAGPGAAVNQHRPADTSLAKIQDMVLEGEWLQSAPMTYRIIVSQRYAVAFVSNNFKIYLY